MGKNERKRKETEMQMSDKIVIKNANIILKDVEKNFTKMFCIPKHQSIQMNEKKVQPYIRLVCAFFGESLLFRYTYPPKNKNFVGIEKRTKHLYLFFFSNIT